MSSYKPGQLKGFPSSDGMGQKKFSGLQCFSSSNCSHICQIIPHPERNRKVEKKHVSKDFEGNYPTGRQTIIYKSLLPTIIRNCIISFISIIILHATKLKMLRIIFLTCICSNTYYRNYFFYICLIFSDLKAQYIGFHISMYVCIYLYIYIYIHYTYNKDDILYF